VLQCCGDVDLAHEAFHRFIADGEFRKQSFDRNSASCALIARQHHAAHAAATDYLNGVESRNRLR
jgi:hypothetical protein